MLCAVVGVALTKNCYAGANAAEAKTSDCGGATHCHGPVFTEYTGYASTSFRCGKCNSANDNTCTDCLIGAAGDNCNAPKADRHTYKCTNFKYDATKKEFVADAAKTTCHAEKDTKKVCNSNGEKADNAYVTKNKGCGPCVSTDKTGNKCVECEGDDCNDPNKITYKCTNFKYDATKKDFVADAAKTTCNAKKDAKKMCNSNGKKADKDYVAKNSGCGPCSDADKKADKCVECEGDDCNSAATITAFLLPMLALFYTLF